MHKQITFVKILLCIVLVFLFVVFGVFIFDATKNNTAEAQNRSFFEEIGRGWCCRIMYDVDTGVMYVVSYGSYNAGTYTVMLNPDGSPRIWEGYSHD